VTTICIIADEILLDGVPVGRLLPNVRLSQHDRLQQAFDSIGEDAAYIAELEHRIARLEARLREPAR
jgi:hypothetical protein